jgi:hypothetical protein
MQYYEHAQQTSMFHISLIFSASLQYELLENIIVSSDDADLQFSVAMRPSARSGDLEIDNGISEFSGNHVC